MINVNGRNSESRDVYFQASKIYASVQFMLSLIFVVTYFFIAVQFMLSLIFYGNKIYI